jgi:aminoglycoside phosphotransferase
MAAAEKSSPAADNGCGPINAGPLARYLTLLAVKTLDSRHLRRLWNPLPGVLSAMNLFIRVKRGLENLAEAHAMQFVARHTSIPVPKVHCAFVHKGAAYIVMSRVAPARMLCQDWHSRSPESKARILDQLRRMVAELRSVPASFAQTTTTTTTTTPSDNDNINNNTNNHKGPMLPMPRIGNICGGPFYDCRLPAKVLWGPFATTRDFHQALVEGVSVDISLEKLSPEQRELRELFTYYRRSSDELILTHGDLSPFNILVHKDDVVAIVDWETAGWFPPYWEYTCAKHANPWASFWAEEVDRFLTPMPYELEMDNIRRKFWGAF